jgi:hypothetical protein
MARTRQKLPTATRRDINTSGIVEEGRSSPDCPEEIHWPLMFLLLLEIGRLLQRNFYGRLELDKVERSG